MGAQVLHRRNSAVGERERPLERPEVARDRIALRGGHEHEPLTAALQLHDPVQALLRGLASAVTGEALAVFSEFCECRREGLGPRLEVVSRKEEQPHRRAEQHDGEHA
jgi:hypothetical protein